MAKSFVMPKTRTPRSAESDAAKLEIKRQFEQLAQDAIAETTPVIVAVSNNSVPALDVVEPKEEEDVVIGAESTSVVDEKPPTTPAPIEDVPQAIAQQSTPAQDIQQSSVLRVMPASDLHVVPEPIVAVENELQASEAVSPSIEPEWNITTAVLSADILPNATLTQSISEMPIVSTSIRNAEYFERTYQQQRRRQITIYPKAEVMERLEAIRYTENVGSSIIIEAALEEYLARFSDRTIGELMRAQGHRLRKAKPTIPKIQR